MTRRMIAGIGLLATISLGAAACSSTSTSDATALQSAAGATSASSPGTPDVAEADRGVVSMRMATVGDPGNASVGVVQTFATGPDQGAPVELPKGTGIYKSCDDAPGPKSCLTVGAVDYDYGIGEFEVTVEQYVTFLNTVDRDGTNPHDLYGDSMNPTVWPQYGSVSFDASAATGAHYAVAFPEWTNKPFNFGDFRRGVRFANSLTNGTVLSKRQETVDGFSYDIYEVRLSPETERGMYDMSSKAPTRTKSTGFVLPSNDEWVKAAYYDPDGGGTESYWAYPTGPFDPPNVTILDPDTGDVTNPEDQPLATYNPNDPNSDVDTPGSPQGAAPTWCPPQTGPNCGSVLPAYFPKGINAASIYMANVSTVGQAKTPSPWGTFDQGGNVVEILDTQAPVPAGMGTHHDFRYYHGGVANAPAYQVEISAFGYFPGDTAISDFYPWLGFRLGAVGEIK